MKLLNKYDKVRATGEFNFFFYFFLSAECCVAKTSLEKRGGGGGGGGGWELGADHYSYREM